MRSLSRQKGFTLVELIISVALGIAAVSAIMFFYVSTLSSSYTTLKKSKLHQEISTLMSIIVQDIRRAGIVNISGLPSDPNFPDQKDVTSNPYNFEPSKLKVWQGAGTSWSLPSANAHVATGQCITFGYDQDLDYSGSGSVEDSDLMGFRWSGDSIEMRSVGDADYASSCTVNGDNLWEPVTDINVINITALNFDLSDSKCINRSEPDEEEDGGTGSIDDSQEFDCYQVTPDSGDLIAEIRIVNVTIEAELVDDDNVTLTLVEQVRVRNDRIYTYP